MPGEAMGAIVKFVHKENPTDEIVINVEYNVIDGFLKEKWNRDGDVPDSRGYSQFPANTSAIIIRLPEYFSNLTKTNGVVPEFVNPKFANAEKTLFKDPTRLECCITDYPKIKLTNGSVGITVYNNWFAFSCVKNNIRDALALYQRGIPPYSAAFGECDYYNWNL
jgi:UDP-sugar pyrophosphorylase